MNQEKKVMYYIFVYGILYIDLLICLYFLLLMDVFISYSFVGGNKAEGARLVFSSFSCSFILKISAYSLGRRRSAKAN